MSKKKTITALYAQELIEAWEANYKQGQLTLWIFLALKESPKTIQQINEYLAKKTSATISADDKSIYRSLCRYHDTEMVDSTTSPSSKGGPPLKNYSLTPLGHTVLVRFVQRNITILLHNPQIKEILQ